MPEDLEARIDSDFTSHDLTSVAQSQCIEVRGVLRRAAHLVRELVPPGRESSLALTKLEEAMFWANAGIARHAKVP